MNRSDRRAYVDPTTNQEIVGKPTGRRIVRIMLNPPILLEHLLVTDTKVFDLTFDPSFE